MSYPLTPPSSSEDSPHSGYLVASPNSNTFEYENFEYQQMQIQQPLIVKPVMADPNYIKFEQIPSLHFIEQPTDRFRFRYKSEMAGTHGSLTGINSDKSRKPTYPTVELRNFSGRAIVRCSIYQSNAIGKDFLPHAHRLIMKKGREEHDDPHDMVIGPEDGFRAVFQGMGIIHTAKKNIVSELTRKKTQLKKEFVARTEKKIRELTAKEQIEYRNITTMPPNASGYEEEDESALTGDLKIVRLDHVVSPAKGNKEVFILVERVTKKNIKIRFYELDDEDRVVWEDWGRFNDLDVHHQYAIVFKTPAYRFQDITSPVNVYVELFRPSDGARSEPRDFRYIPNKNQHKPGQKRARYDYSSSNYSSEMGSDEIPVPINNLQIGQTNMDDLNIPSGLSEEMRRALANINSDEFQNLYKEADLLNLLETDAPKANDGNIPSRSVHMHSIRAQAAHYVKMEVSNEEKKMAHNVIEQLKKFFKTTHKREIAIEFIQHFFGEDIKTNALHVMISLKDNSSAKLLLKIIAYYGQYDLIHKKNNDQQTPLHIAVLCLNTDLVKTLLRCNASNRILDSSLNSPLHLAVQCNAPIEILELLLTDQKNDKIADFIDLENDEGNTALWIAIDKKNLAAIKLLCQRGADVNKYHPKNGFVPLRFAIEKGHTDIVKFLLSLNLLNTSIRDFKDKSPCSAAFNKDTKEDITRAVQQYMEDHNIREIKEEPEDSDSEPEMEIDEEAEVKTELPYLSNEELKKLYKEVTSLTPQCLDEISAILDSTGNWKHLAELLEIDHLITSGIIKSDTSMSKAVLIHSIETNRDSIWMIREFLEALDEFKAVEVIDRMVLESKTC